MLNVYEEIAGLAKIRKDYHTPVPHCETAAMRAITANGRFGALLR